MSGFPLLVYGQVTESGTGVDSITVKVRNNSTNDVGTATTDSDGLYLMDLSDDNYFPNGYAVGQSITVYTIYSSFEGETTFTLLTNIYGYEKNIALTAVTDSDLIAYCTVQDVYDEMDGKTSDDISTSRVVSAIRRAEGLIDVKTGTFFKEVTLTDEVHNVDRYSIEASPVYLDTINPPANMRTDYWGGGIVNRVKTIYSPVVSITSLSRNTAGFNAADSWTALTQQTGSAGDYILADSGAGIIDFVNNYPKFGYRSWKLTYVAGHDRDSTDRKIQSLLKVVERLTILIAVKSIITTKTSGAMFDSTRDVKIGAIEIKAGAGSGGQYIKSIEPEIAELWKEIGELGIEVI